MEIRQIIQRLPLDPGVYIFLDKSNKVIYVGKSVSLKKRVASYFTSKDLGPKTNLLVKNIADVTFIKVFSEFEALLLESELIKKHKPFFNIQSKDDKSPIYIKISNEAIPLVTVTRRLKKKNGEFLAGPFPSAKVTREVLRTIRRIFPYCHHKYPKRACLFVHLGLCPYPYKSESAKIEYLKSIGKIKKLLSGKSKAVIRDLSGEMKTYSRVQQFEEAAAIKNQIVNLKSILTTYHTPREFLEQPTLVDDLNSMRLRDLKSVLQLDKIPRRIECYDISNISGKLATGSMVVFENGKAARSEYRRFKIKFTHKPNDYVMLKEVIVRRLNNSWPLPDLMIIDGGRGQLTIALSVLRKYKTVIPVVSLAKRFEEIYMAGNIVPISLSKDSPARQLAQAIRDEAHRFAVTYHRLLRSKYLLQTDKTT